MRTLAFSALALGVLTTAATAEPVTPPPALTDPVVLTGTQMDQVTAGQAEVIGRPPTGSAGAIVTPGASVVVEPGEPLGGGPAEYLVGGPGQEGSILVTPGAPGFVFPGP